jgi:hypothetical protein
MGYLNNSSVTIDAILTNKGRELLAMGRDEFKITQFALADDEIDYDLWNAAHPLGTAYYGSVIENLPMIEALPDETQMMKYKLVTLPKKTARIPVIELDTGNITLRAGGQTAVVKPSTPTFENGNATLGYTAILSDSDVADLRVAAGGRVNAGVSPSVPRFIGDNDSAQSISVVGKQFEIIAKPQIRRDRTATLTIIGNETGGRKQITVTVKKAQTFTTRGFPIAEGRRIFRLRS